MVSSDKVGVTFIINHKAGSGRKAGITDAIKRLSEEYNVSATILPTQRRGHAAELAAEAEDSVIVVAGGDGTVNETASSLIGSGKMIGIVPCGSGNGLARHLSISLDFEEAIKRILDKKAEVTAIDAGMINGHTFLCTCGVGLDADIAMEFSKSKKRGMSTYIKTFLKRWRNFKPSEYILNADGNESTVQATMITVGNAGQWGNNALITPDAELSDGLLDVTVIRSVTPLSLPLMTIRLFDGHIYECEGVRHFKCRNLKIIRESEGAAHYDGEPVLLGKEINISIIERCLKILK